MILEQAVLLAFEFKRLEGDKGEDVPKLKPAP